MKIQFHTLSVFAIQLWRRSGLRHRSYPHSGSFQSLSSAKATLSSGEGFMILQGPAPASDGSWRCCEGVRRRFGGMLDLEGMDDAMKVGLRSISPADTGRKLSRAGYARFPDHWHTIRARRNPYRHRAGTSCRRQPPKNGSPAASITPKRCGTRPASPPA